MPVDIANPRHQLIARELVFVVLATSFVLLPAILSIGVFAWATLGCLLAIAAVHPRALLLAVPLTIPLSFNAAEFGALRFNVLEILVLAATVGYLPRIVSAAWNVWRMEADQRHNVLRQVIPDRLAAGMALLLVLGGVIATLWMADPTNAAESLRTLRWTILVPVTYFFLAAPVLHIRGEFRLISAGLLIAGASISAFIAVIDGVFGGGVQADAVTRLSGLAPHPNALALVLDRALVLGILIAVLFRQRIAMYWLIPSLAVTAVTLLTFSRGAVLGMTAALLIILVLAQARRLAIAAIGMSITGVAGMLLMAPNRTLSLLGGGSGSLRLELWQSSLRMIQDHPVTGVGPDQFLYQYLPRYVTPEAWPERFTSHPHNLILDSWLSLGIIGLIVLVMAGALIVRHARTALAQRDRVTLAAVGALIAAGIHGLFDQSYFLPELAVSGWLLICIMIPGQPNDGSPQDEQQESGTDG